MHVRFGRGLSVAALFLLSASSACKSESERKLTDTEGRTFTAKCERSGACALSQTSGAQRKDGKTAQSLLLTGRVIDTITDAIFGEKPGYGGNSMPRDAPE